MGNLKFNVLKLMLHTFEKNPLFLFSVYKQKPLLSFVDEALLMYVSPKGSKKSIDVVVANAPFSNDAFVLFPHEIIQTTFPSPFPSISRFSFSRVHSILTSPIFQVIGL